MATARQIMEKAISFIGTKENPAGSNKVIFNTDYYEREVQGSAYPWCCSYVWDIFRMCNASNLFNDGKKTAYCPTVENWGRLAKQTVPYNEGQYGDIILFDFYGKGVACHIGFIESKNADGSYNTVEGNTSTSSNDNGGCVMRRVRKPSSIKCIVRPKYDKQEKTATTTRKTVDEVAKEVIDGKWGSGEFRKTALTQSGYDYNEVQNKVNELLSKTSKKYVPPAALPTIRRGTTGSQVNLLQQDLNYVMKTNLVTDGIAGTKTINALKDFQKLYKLSQDGVYGKKSADAMEKALK